MNRMVSILAALMLAACPGGGGDDGDAGHGAGGACDDIVEACHAVGSASTEANDCHELGHDGPTETCDTRRAECIAICEAIAADAGPPDACETISHACHAYDTGSGPAHDCHEVGHANDLAACDGALAGCLMTCSGDAGSHGPDEDAGDHGEDAGAATDGGGHAH